MSQLNPKKSQVQYSSDDDSESFENESYQSDNDSNQTTSGDDIDAMNELRELSRGLQNGAEDESENGIDDSTDEDKMDIIEGISKETKRIHDRKRKKMQNSSLNYVDLSPSKQEDEMDDTDVSEEVDVESNENKPAFTIICKVDSDDDEDYHERLIKEAEKEELNRKKALKEDENAKWIARKKDLEFESIWDNLPRSATGVRIVQPFNYELIKKQQDSSGVIYVEKPQIVEYQNKKALRKHFEEYGTINRIEADVILKGKKHIIRGYYIEFAKKSIAKRVAETLNGAPISRKDSRVLIIRYLDKFSWSQVQDEHSKKLMLRKLMRLQATNELRSIQAFEKRRKLSSSLKKQKKTKGDKFIFAQKKFKDYVSKESNLHIDFMPFLGEKSS